MPTGIAKPIGSSCLVSVFISSYLWREQGGEEVSYSGQWAGQTKLLLGVWIDGPLPSPPAGEKTKSRVGPLESQSRSGLGPSSLAHLRVSKKPDSNRVNMARVKPRPITNGVNGGDVSKSRLKDLEFESSPSLYPMHRQVVLMKRLYEKCGHALRVSWNGDKSASEDFLYPA